MMDKPTKEKLDKIIELLEDIKANQPVPSYPPILYPIVDPGWPGPYVPYPHYPETTRIPNCTTRDYSAQMQQLHYETEH